ncbi:SDR family NAD(P)-dependent oxidoreductase [Winogradskyella sp. PG-2]|uniref:SDR family NAD(P)-dependent oxidoreductase n=1 Tax=Winogradskyella sp. PG-2 TaxID=754409 RepID=UPI00045886DE|nr:SDR family oxidoreductase [Winogradskyella sp. PG-2]BAO76610.1 3-oxoacyl-[acyl-carrier protein] reductase [Winogradskyella sp. PG-2]
MDKHNTKTALVTGSASGLGYELALLLAKDNYNLILIDIDSVKLEQAKININKTYQTKIEILARDLYVVNIAQEIYNHVTNTEIDVIINNAGFGLFGTFHDTDWERESEMLHLHIITTTHLIKLFLPDMVKRGSGRILNLSSLAAFQSGPLMALYYASKSYLLSFSQAIANELKGTGVTVTVLCPGPTRTAFQDLVSEGCNKNKIAFNMACPKEVATYGYKAMHNGRVVAIPGLFNKFLSILPRMLTRNRTTKIVRQIQDKNRDS